MDGSEKSAGKPLAGKALTASEEALAELDRQACLLSRNKQVQRRIVNAIESLKGSADRPSNQLGAFLSMFYVAVGPVAVGIADKNEARFGLELPGGLGPLADKTLAAHRAGRSSDVPFQIKPRFADRKTRHDLPEKAAALNQEEDEDLEVYLQSVVRQLDRCLEVTDQTDDKLSQLQEDIEEASRVYRLSA